MDRIALYLVEDQLRGKIDGTERIDDRARRKLKADLNALIRRLRSRHRSIVLQSRQRARESLLRSPIKQLALVVQQKNLRRDASAEPARRFQSGIAINGEVKSMRLAER